MYSFLCVTSFTQHKHLKYSQNLTTSHHLLCSHCGLSLHHLSPEIPVAFSLFATHVLAFLQSIVSIAARGTIS